MPVMKPMPVKTRHEANLDPHDACERLPDLVCESTTVSVVANQETEPSSRMRTELLYERPEPTGLGKRVPVDPYRVVGACQEVGETRD